MNILFLADKFADSFRSETARYIGGAERTDDVAIKAAPFPITCATWDNVPTLSNFDWIVVGNSADAPERELKRLAATGRHVLFEHDLRICHWRGNFPVSWDPVHRWSHRCVCPHPTYRELFDNAAGTIFLTSLQKRYFDENPFWEVGRPASILGSSLFGEPFLSWVANRKEQRRTGTAILSTATKIKGSAQARAMCEKEGWVINAIENMPPEQVWETLSMSERFVYLPLGLEPAGRMPVEARLLGCEVIANEHTGVASEPIWKLQGSEFRSAIESQPNVFWAQVASFFES